MKHTLIKTEKQYDEALERLNVIFDASPNSKEGQEAELLNEEWIKYIIGNEIHHLGICRMEKIESLTNNSCAEASQSFKDLSGYQLIEPKNISLYVTGKVPRIDGYPYFIGSAIIDSVSEQCVSGYFNIVTGDFEVREYYCGPIN